MTEDELRAELLAILADVRAMKRERAAPPHPYPPHATSTQSPVRQLPWPVYVEPAEYREAREALFAMNQETREELRAMGEDIPPELRCVLEETDHLTSKQLMERTLRMLAYTAELFKDELGIDDLEQQT